MIDLNRLRQIFGNPQSGPAIGGVNPSEGFPGMPFPQDPMIEANNDGTPIADEFLKAISEMPQRENPNIWRKLAAIGPAIAGNQEGMDNTLYGDFNRKMGDWKNRIQPLYQAAGLERMNNSQEAREAYQQMMAAISGQRLEETERRNRTTEAQANERIRQGDERIGVAERNASTAEKRLEVYRETAKGGSVVRDNKNGKTYLLYKDGTKKDVGIDTLSKEDEMDLAQAGRLQIIEAQEGSRERIARLQSELDREEAAERERLRAERVAKEKEDKEKSDSQRKVERAMRIEKFKNENPQYRDLIDEEGQVKEPTSPGIGGTISRFMGRDLTPEVRAAIVKHIEEGTPYETPGKATPTVPNPSAANPTSSRFTTKPSAPANTGKAPVQMIGPDGKTYNVPADKVEQAKKDGMRLK